MRIAIASGRARTRRALESLVRRCGHELAWSAADGAATLTEALGDPPDALLLDPILPGTNAIQVIRELVCSRPCPILIVTHQPLDRSPAVFEAIAAGALDAVVVPPGPGLDPRFGAELIARVEMLVRACPEVWRRRGHAPAMRSGAEQPVPLVVLAASAGGPSQIREILSALPHDFPAACVIAQHLDPDFVAGFCAWLDRESELQVQPARVGDRPRAGRVDVADPRAHLVVDGEGRYRYRDEPGAGCRPSVDRLLASLPDRGRLAVAVLSGIGDDGALALPALRQRGALVLAQEGAPVDGMPRAACATGVVSAVLPVERIAAALRLWASGGPAGSHR